MDVDQRSVLVEHDGADPRQWHLLSHFHVSERNGSSRSGHHEQRLVGDPEQAVGVGKVAVAVPSVGSQVGDGIAQQPLAACRRWTFTVRSGLM